MSDVNFAIAPQNPLPGMMQALQFGSAIGGIRDQRAQAAAMQQAQMQRQAELTEAYRMVRDNPTFDNYERLANLDPERAESIRSNFKLRTEDEQRSMLSETAQIYSALRSGNTQIAVDLMQQKADAYRNAGNDQVAKQTQTLIDLIKVGDQGAKAVEDFFGLTIAQMPGGKEAMESVAKFAEDRRAEQLQPAAMEQALADIGLTKAQTNKILSELEESKSSGMIDPEKRFSSELQLNNAYTTRTKGYAEALRLDQVIKTAAQAGTGAGDLSLITSFMKMLDPGSVVRETEFAAAQDTGGLLAKLTAAATRVQNGQILTPQQRTEFATLSGKYMQAAADQEKRVRDDMMLFVKNYGLNPENVFGTVSNQSAPIAVSASSEAQPPQAAPVQQQPPENVNIDALKTYIISRNPNDKSKIDALKTIDELKNAYPNSYNAYIAQGQTATRTVEVDY